MGIFGKIRDYISGANYSSRNITNGIVSSNKVCLNEIYLNMKNDKQKDISDLILEKYEKEKGVDLEKKIMEKYFKLNSADLVEIQQNLENAEIENDVDEVSKEANLDKDTAKQTKKELKENKDGKGIDKKELKNKVYETAYKKMYTDYSNKVLQMKNNQFYDKDLAIGTDEAVEMLALEKSLQRVEIQYTKNSSRKISDEKNIKDKKREFRNQFDYTQKGTDNNAQEIVNKINRLYILRDEKYREYIDALADKSKSPQEIAMYKKDFDEANVALIENVPSLAEYSKDLDVQSQNMKLAKDKGLEKSSALNNEVDMKDINSKTHNLEKVEQSNVAINIDKSTIQRENMEIKNMEYANRAINDQLENGKLDSTIRAERMVSAKEASNTYRENIDRVDSNRTKTNAEQEVKEEENDSKRDFINSLKQYNDIEITEEEAKKMAEERNYDKDIEVKNKNANQEYQRERRRKNNSQF